MFTSLCFQPATVLGEETKEKAKYWLGKESRGNGLLILGTLTEVLGLPSTG